MKNMFEKSTYTEISSRLETLSPESKPVWGKMNVAQMMAHASAALEIATGQKTIKQSLLGKIIGPFAKAGYVSEKPFSKGSPTANEFIIKDERNFSAEKERLAKLITAFHEGGHEKCTTHPHGFFGFLTTDEWSKTQYKHLDHHFRQFGA